MVIQLTGLGSFDSSGVVTQLVAIAHQPIDALNTRQTQLNSAVSTLGTFSSRLATLKANTNTLLDTTSYSSITASSTDTSVAVSSTGAAQVGSYSVQVTGLASAQKLRSDTQTDSATALGMTGTLSIQVGTGTSVPIDVAATDTLADIATKLSSSGARISASVLFDGSTYRLSVQGLDTGAANAFTITQSGFDLGLEKPVNKYQSAADASLVVDGVNITRPTNQITGVIPGVTLAVTKIGVTSTVNVGSDTTTLKSKINGFVSAFNDIVNASHTATGYGSAKASNPILAGDSSIRRVVDLLARTVSSAVPGTSGAYTTLASIGIHLTTAGTLTFDSTKLDAGILADPGGVRKLFVTDASLGATGVMKTLGTAIDSFTTGAGAPIQSRIDALTASSKGIDDLVAQKQLRVDAYEAQLKKQFTNLDVMMSKFNSMSSAIGSIGSQAATTTSAAVA